MYSRPLPEVEAYRVRHGEMASDASYGNNGLFVLRHPSGVYLRMICSDGMGWEHVSVSINNVLERPLAKRRVPTWEEMCWVKNRFWPIDQWVVQFHPAASEYVNLHPYCLHLWRPCDAQFPTPARDLVG